MPAAIPAALTAFTNAVATYVSSAAFAVGFSGVTASAIGSAVGSFALGALSLGAMGSGLAATLGGLAATAGVSALLQPDVPKVGAQIQAKAGSVIPRTMVMGRTAAAGVLANDTFYSGRDNGVATQFYILSGAGDCGTIEKILIGDDEVTFNSPVNNIYRAMGKYSGALWMCQKSGSWTQAAINFNSGGNGLESGAHPSEWTTNHRLLGCMNMCLMIGRYNEPIKSNGLNGTVLSIVKAENVGLIDPRTGSAATTWAQKQNPWVWAYSYLKNITSSVSPTGVVLAGCNMPDSGIDATSFAFAANIADANGWTIAGEVVLESSKKNEILSGMCQAGGGSYTFRNGKVYATVAGIKAVAGYLTNDHIREDISVAPLSPAQTIPNRIIPRFISEANQWKVIDGSVITDASFVTQDGTERTINYEIPYCGNGAAQAAKLAALALVNSREPFQFDVPLMPSGRYLALPGDCLQITADLTDWVGQKILVNKLTGNGDLTANIHATSETDSKYAWALGQTTVPPDYTASVLIDKSYVATPTGTAWTVTGTQITQGDNIVPCIRVAGSASEYAGCGGIVVEYKPAAGSTWFGAGDLVYTSSGIEITSVTPNTSYNVRIAYYNKYGVRGTFYTPAAVTTGDLQAGMSASADIANGIVDQSPIAAGNSLTTDDVNNALIPTGTNQLVNSDLSRGRYGFGFDTTNVTEYGVDGDFVNSEYYGKSHVIGGAKSGVLASGTYIDAFNSLGRNRVGGSLENANKFSLKVKQGDRCYIRGMFAKHRLDRIEYWALICSYDGTLVSAVAYQGGREGGAGDHADLSTFDLLGGIFDVTSPDAAFMQIMVRIHGNGGSNPYWFCRDLAMGKVAAGQTVLPPYTVGIIDKVADETGSNTALAIVNQSPIAAGNSLTTSDVTNSLITINSNGTLNNAGGGQVTIGGIGGVDVSTFSAAITNEATTRAGADTANANAIATVSAKLDVAPNLFPYPRPKNLTDAPSSYGWITEIWGGSGAFNVNYANGDSYWKGSYYYIDRIQANAPATARAARFNIEPLQCGFGALYANKPITISARAAQSSGVSGDNSSVYLIVTDASGNIVAWADTPNLPINTSVGYDKRQSWTFNFSSLPQNPIPADGYKLAVVFRHDLSATNSSPPYQFLGFTDIKVEFGSVATAFTLEGNAAVLQASITDTRSVALDASGKVYALAGTQATVNGRTGGFILDNNGVVVGFQITADTFAFKTPNGNKNLFGYDGSKFYFTTDVKVSGNLLIDGSVNNQKIADGSIGNVQSWRTANSYQPAANNTWYNVGSLPITAAGKLIKVEFGCFGWANTLISSNANNGIMVRVRRDNTTLFENGIGAANIVTVGEVQFVQEYNNGFSFAVLDIPAAGVHTYYLDILANNKDYAGISYPYIILQEFIKL